MEERESGVQTPRYKSTFFKSGFAMLSVGGSAASIYSALKQLDWGWNTSSVLIALALVLNATSVIWLVSIHLEFQVQKRRLKASIKSARKESEEARASVEKAKEEARASVEKAKEEARASVEKAKEGVAKCVFMFARPVPASIVTDARLDITTVVANASMDNIRVEKITSEVNVFRPNPGRSFSTTMTEDGIKTDDEVALVISPGGLAETSISVQLTDIPDRGFMRAHVVGRMHINKDDRMTTVPFELTYPFLLRDDK